MASVSYIYSLWSGEPPLSSGNPCNYGNQSDDPNSRRSIAHGFVRDRIRRGKVESDRCEKEEQQSEDIQRQRDRERKSIWAG